MARGSLTVSGVSVGDDVLVGEVRRAIAVQADVTREDDVARLFTLTRETLGPVSCLVNNAGATLNIGHLADTPVATIRAVIDVNLLSAILCARRAAQLIPPTAAVPAAPS